MKRAVNLRLDESIIVTLNQLANELNTTKAQVVEKALKFFKKLSKNKKMIFYNLQEYLKTMKQIKCLKIYKIVKISKILSWIYE